MHLLLVKGSLVLILIGMIIVGRRNGIWPVINWPMYARLFEMPKPVASELRLDLVMADGLRKPFMMREIAPIGEHQIVAAMVQCTQTEEDPSVRKRCIRSIETLARRKVAPDRAIRAIEMWEVQWDIDVLALPPLDRNHPDEQRLIGRLYPQRLSAPNDSEVRSP
jgi:hypothetical protein